MSMLAEKRQKTNWILNPRSTEWTNDSYKYGQRILEKMGWTPGKGLGVNEQGMVNALRIKYKNDFKGLGHEHKVEDWIKTQEEFNSMLEELNGGEKYKQVGEKSLEKTSKNIRSRVHYHKFTRGKDLSRYSAKDLESILGMNTDTNIPKGATKKVSIEEEVVRGEYENFIKTDVIDFKDHEEQLEEMALNVNIHSNNETKITKKKKKKKKKRMKQGELVEEESNFVAKDENDDGLSASKRRKKKKH